MTVAGTVEVFIPPTGELIFCASLPFFLRHCEPPLGGVAIQSMARFWIASSGFALFAMTFQHAVSPNKTGNGER